MRSLTILVTALAAASCDQSPTVSQTFASPPGPVRTVAVELFTSQGCSSCPPADALLERIAAEPNIVVLTRPVTYWDRLGWPDTLARPENDQQQLRYSGRFGQPGEYYTPEAVVQGGAGLVGSNETELRAKIADARRQHSPALRIEAGRVILSGEAAQPAEVRLLALQSQADVAIGRGENGGRHVRYTNVVLAERSLGQWQGGAAQIELRADALRTAGADRFAILVQEPDGGPILAAVYL